MAASLMGDNMIIQLGSSWISLDYCNEEDETRPAAADNCLDWRNSRQMSVVGDGSQWLAIKATSKDQQCSNDVSWLRGLRPFLA